MQPRTKRTCFVCQASEEEKKLLLHPEIMTPVCTNCHNTEAEKQKINELQEGLAEGFVCGCI